MDPVPLNDPAAIPDADRRPLESGGCPSQAIRQYRIGGIL